MTGLQSTIVCLFAGLLSSTAAPLDFTRDIRPLLSDACYNCHGPDAKARKAGLRLDDQPTTALLQDLKQGGMLEDTLVLWGGEFGRTVYCQSKLTDKVYGRDHHPNCFAYWLTGGGVRGGITHGETDDCSVNIAVKPVHVHDLQATILHQLGIHHERLTFRDQGRYYRLTDVHSKVVHDFLT